MLIEYHRPQTLEETLTLITRPAPLTLPLGGGTVLNTPHPEEFAVADLQALPLKSIELRGSTLEIGATATLQALLDFPDLSPALAKALYHEATANLRRAGTVAGTLIASDGRSPLAATLLALDTQLTLQPGDETHDLGNILQLRQTIEQTSKPANQQTNFFTLPHRLLTLLTFSTKPALAYEYVARTPADRPIVTVAAAKWPSGRLRVVVGGWGHTPRLALDAPEPGGVEYAVRNITAEAGDEWGSAEYRQDVAVTLTHRALQTINV
ncbi:MAG: FAD binding domain-containing protein [Anaerolineales bacterium]|nr:FAD binding domain-containing protein [Anaerolineales bacterium]